MSPRQAGGLGGSSCSCQHPLARLTSKSGHQARSVARSRWRYGPPACVPPLKVRCGAPPHRRWRCAQSNWKRTSRANAARGARHSLGVTPSDSVPGWWGPSARQTCPRPRGTTNRAPMLREPSVARCVSTPWWRLQCEAWVSRRSPRAERWAREESSCGRGAPAGPRWVLWLALPD